MANPIITVLTVTGIVGSTGAAVAMNTDILTPPAQVQSTKEPIVVHIPAEEPDPIIITEIIGGDTSTSAPTEEADEPNTQSKNDNNTSAKESTPTTPPATNTHTGGSSVSSGEDEDDDDDEDEYENEDHEDEDDEDDD